MTTAALKPSKNGPARDGKNRLTEESVRITIAPARFHTLRFRLTGTAPYMQNRMSAKAMNMMREKMEAGSTATKGKKRAPRDFTADFKNAMHVSQDGWIGVPASAFRNACIDVCRVAGFKMTHAKLSIFVEADGFDGVDGTPLVRLEAGEPEKVEMPVRNATGVLDIRARPLWREWSIVIRVRYDADQFTPDDVTNLLVRVGLQVGIGEGRAFSRQSNGLGYGFFAVEVLDIVK